MNGITSVTPPKGGVHAFTIRVALKYMDSALRRNDVIG